MADVGVVWVVIPSCHLCHARRWPMSHGLCEGFVATPNVYEHAHQFGIAHLVVSLSRLCSRVNKKVQCLSWLSTVM